MTPDTARWCLDLLGKVVMAVLAGAGLAFGLIVVTEWVCGRND
jgi:hypothetical protein